jgi:hypothetical protein
LTGWAERKLLLLQHQSFSAFVGGLILDLLLKITPAKAKGGARCTHSRDTHRHVRLLPV